MIDRVTSSRLGPGQRPAVTAIEARDGPRAEEIRWTLAHLGVEGNEMADLYTKGAAESAVYAVDRLWGRVPVAMGLGHYLETRVKPAAAMIQSARCVYVLPFILRLFDRIPLWAP